MNKYLIISTLLVAALAFPADDLAADRSIDGKIVGGDDVDIESHPYQISMQFFDIHYCGGAIISPKYCATAGHCVDGFPAWSVTVRVGSSIKHEGGEVFNVSEIAIHDYYNWRLIDFDIAILTLAEELKFGPGINAIAIQDENKITEGSPAFVTGWGALSEGGSSSSRLQGVQVYYVTSLDCQNSYRNIENAEITPRMICAGYVDGGRDACQGDSGGPLTQNGHLIGLVSWGVGCARAEYPGVYTRLAISSVRSFIRAVAGV